MKRPLRLGCRMMILAIAVFAVISGAGTANALSIFGLEANISLVNLTIPINIGVPEGVPFDVKYSEFEDRFSLSVNTNSLFDPDKTYKFDVKRGALWDVNLTFDYKNVGFFGDESVFELIGNAQHKVRPPGLEHLMDEREGQIFRGIDFPSFNLNTNLTDPRWSENRIVFSKPDCERHLPMHGDCYNPNLLTIRRNAGDLAEVSSFSYALDGTHVVPEPSTLLLLGSSLAGLGGFAWRRQRRK